MVQSRSLSASEKNLARGVFWDTLPLDRIKITDVVGLGGKPFTVPSTWAVVSGFEVLRGISDGGLAEVGGGIVGGLLAGFAINAITGLFLGGQEQIYLLNLGPAVFNGDATTTPFGGEPVTGETFVHGI
jgi:hypothetical protein